MYMYAMMSSLLIYKEREGERIIREKERERERKIAKEKGKRQQRQKAVLDRETQRVTGINRYIEREKELL
jgi:hypothetical protein